ncbi:porin family protein [Saccharobesus litoralis]|nr:porin family protein [Saccharobesus litoralis]
MKKTAIALLLSTFAATSFAQGFSGELLISKTDFDQDGFSDSATMLGLRGSYEFSETISGELSYTSGEMDDTKIDFSTLTLGAKFSHAVSDVASINARLGFGSWEAEGNGGSVDGTDLYYGIGGQYSFNEKAYAGLEYIMMDADDTDVSALTLSIGYKF